MYEETLLRLIAAMTVIAAVISLISALVTSIQASRASRLKRELDAYLTQFVESLKTFDDEFCREMDQPKKERILSAIQKQP